LVRARVFFFLILDIITYYFLIPTNRRYKISPRPKVKSREVTLTLAIRPRYIDGAFPFDVPDHLRYRVLRWDRYQHVNMIGHHVAFQDPAFFLLRQAPKNASQIPPHGTKKRFLATFRNEDNVKLGSPISCGLGSQTRPSRFDLSWLACSRLEKVAVDRPKRQTSTVTPAKPGDYPFYLI
jgi:hypothetical protein